MGVNLSDKSPKEIVFNDNPGMFSIRTSPAFPSADNCWNFPFFNRSALGIKVAISTSTTSARRDHDVGLKTAKPAQSTLKNYLAYQPLNPDTLHIEISKPYLPNFHLP